jgi:hypothetical protein
LTFEIELELGEFCGVFGYSTSLWFCFFRLSMALVEKTVLVPHSAEQMFNLVDRVEEYPQFCRGAAEVSSWRGRRCMPRYIDYHHITELHHREYAHAAASDRHDLTDGPLVWTALANIP